eukprot:GEMP01025029.1.p1 GENE.GEMP01025029.1~~GEMP01025029.1.p1  ORF type:complete len:619 (+),score=97.78 GEMP01025029.1:57-1913(+)
MLSLVRFGFLGVVTAGSIENCKPLKGNKYFIDNCTPKIKDVEINNKINVETGKFDELPQADVHEKRTSGQVPLEPQPNKTHCIVKICTADSTDFVIEGGHLVSQNCATTDDMSIEWDKHAQDSCKCGQHTCRQNDLENSCYPDESFQHYACTPDWFCPAHDEDNVLKCKDNSTCNPYTDEEAWACCTARGGRLQCPKNAPFMCQGKHPMSCGGDHCCQNIPHRCLMIGTGLLQQCPTPKGESSELCPINKLNGTEVEYICKDGHRCSTYAEGDDCCSTHKGIRQCPVYRPVMCANDFGCAKVANPSNATDVVLEDHCCQTTKVQCANHGGIWERCPVVPTCAGDEVWETTFVGGIASASCGQDANGTKLTGVKYRHCNSTLVDEVEKTEWTKVIDHCSAVPQKCENVAHDNVPFLVVNASMLVSNKNCSDSQEGFTKYTCEEVPGARYGKNRVSSFCQDPCTCKNGLAVSFLNEERYNVSMVCSCFCFSGFSGPMCEEEENRAAVPTIPTTWTAATIPTTWTTETATTTVTTAATATTATSVGRNAKAHKDKEFKRIFLTAMCGLVLLVVIFYIIVKYMPCCKSRQDFDEDADVESDESNVEEGNIYENNSGVEATKC